MNKVGQRLLVFFLGIPIVLGIVYVPVLCHLPFNILLVAVSALAAYELCLIFNSSNNETLPKPLVITLSSAITVFTYIYFANVYFTIYSAANRATEIVESNEIFVGMVMPSFNLFDISLMVLIIGIFIIFAVEIFSAKTFEKSNARIVRSICVLLYCGLLPSYITRFTFLNNSFAHITTFLVLVFISDSAAWLFGVLFGKNNRGKIAASPNKSIAGFIGAYVGCILFAYLFTYLIFPAAFNVAENKSIKVLVLALVVCTASIIGDLAESVFKRSANVKDSGNVIMGRGGMLDCVDSVFMAAPFYFYTSVMLFFSHL